MTEVTCPCCNAKLSYSAICRQVAQQFAERKYDLSELLEIIEQVNKANTSGHWQMKTTTGEVKRKYEESIGKGVSYRQLNYMLHDLADQGCIRLRVESKGRYGRTTVILFLKSLVNQVKEKKPCQ
jgi:hypothetical protein